MKINDVPSIFSAKKFAERYDKVKTHLGYNNEDMMALIGLSKSVSASLRKGLGKASKRNKKLILHFMYLTEDIPNQTRRDRLLSMINDRKVINKIPISVMATKIGVHHQYMYEFINGRYYLYSDSSMKIIKYFVEDVKELDVDNDR